MYPIRLPFSLHRGFFLFVLLILSAAVAAQAHRKRLSVEASLPLRQEALLYYGDFDGEVLDQITEDPGPTIGLNYRVGRRFTLYGEYMRSGYFSTPTVLGADRQHRYSAYTVGLMPLSGFFEFGIGFSRITRQNFRYDKPAEERLFLNDWTVNGANLRMRFDVKIFNGFSVFAGVTAYGTLPNDFVDDIEVIGNASAGVQIYLLGNDKKFAPRQE